MYDKTLTTVFLLFAFELSLSYRKVDKTGNPSEISHFLITQKWWELYFWVIHNPHLDSSISFCVLSGRRFVLSYKRRNPTNTRRRRKQQGGKPHRKPNRTWQERWTTCLNILWNFKGSLKARFYTLVTAHCTSCWPNIEAAPADDQRLFPVSIYYPCKRFDYTAMSHQINNTHKLQFIKL